MNNFSFFTTTILTQKLRAEWLSLWNSSPHAHFFNHPDWVATSHQMFGNGQVTYVSMFSKDSLIAVLPLMNQNWFGLTMLSFPGGRFLDKASLLVREYSTEVINALLEYVKFLGSMYLAELPEELIQRIDSSDYTIKQSDINYFLPVSEGLSHLSNKDRNKLNAIIQNPSLKISHECFKGNTKGLNIAFQIDVTSAKAHKYMATFTDPANKSGYEKLLQRHKNDIHIDVIYTQGLPIIYSIGLSYHKTYLGINTSFNPDFKSIMPGKIMIALILRRLQAEGYEEYDFSRGDNFLKREFTPHKRLQYSVIYTRQPLVKTWIDTAHMTYHALFENKTFYHAYRRLRKLTNTL